MAIIIVVISIDVFASGKKDTYDDEFEDYINNYTVCDSSMNIHLFEEGENSKSLIEMQEVFCNFSGELKNVTLKKKSFEKSVYDLDSNLYTAILQNEYENISTKELLFAKRINDGFKLYRLMIIFDSAEMKY